MRPLPILLAGLCVAFAPGLAEACSLDYCATVPRWESLELRSISPVPQDGAFVFLGPAGDHDCLADLEPHIAVDVRLGGAQVDGVTELLEDLSGLIVWRPDAPLEPGATYALHVEIDNDAIAYEPDCGPGRLQADFTVETAAAAEAEPPAPTLDGEMTMHTGAIGGLGTLACCPGVAAGFETTDSCGGQSIVWSPEGENGCTYIHERTSMYMDFVGVHAPAPALVGQYIYELRFDGELRHRSLEPNPYIRWFRGQPVCATLEALHLGSGARLASKPLCFGQDVAAEFGVRTIDVAAALACVPQVCAVVDDHTDPTDCVAYDPANPPSLPEAPMAAPGPICPAPVIEDGCDCAQAPAPGPWALLLGLWLARRRRPSRSGRASRARALAAR